MVETTDATVYIALTFLSFCAPFLLIALVTGRQTSLGRPANPRKTTALLGTALVLAVGAVGYFGVQLHEVTTTNRARIEAHYEISDLSFPAQSGGHPCGISGEQSCTALATFTIPGGRTLDGQVHAVNHRVTLHVTDERTEKLIEYQPSP